MCNEVIKQASVIPKLGFLAIDIERRNRLSFIMKEGCRPNASILCEMQGQKGNEGYQEYNHEKWEAGNSRGVPSMWDQDVQDWEELSSDIKEHRTSSRAGYFHRLNIQPFLLQR